MKFTIALLQLLSFGMDQNKNLKKGIEYCLKAKAKGADLVLFSELWNIGFTMCPFDESGKQEWEKSAIDEESAFFLEFKKTAKNLNINIALPYLQKHRPKPKNSVAIINSNGDVVLNYSKRFICNFGLEELSKQNPNYNDVGCDYNCSPGNEFPVCTIGKKGDKVVMGAMICADREFPEAATALMLNGAELILVPNSCEWDDMRKSILKTRAFENQVGIAMTNYPSPKNNGHSSAYHCVAWNDQGNQETLIIEANEIEGMYLAEFDIDQIRRFRKSEEWRLNYRKNFT